MVFAPRFFLPETDASSAAFGRRFFCRPMKSAKLHMPQPMTKNIPSTIQSTPSDAVILERAKSFGNQACFTVALQCRRAQGVEPEDRVFLTRVEADLRFMLIALRQLRRAAELAAQVAGISPELQKAMDAFDARLPALRRMRNVEQHMDEYVLGKGRDKSVVRGALQVNTWDGVVFRWLGEQLNVEEAEQAAVDLFVTLSGCVKAWSSTAKPAS